MKSLGKVKKQMKKALGEFETEEGREQDEKTKKLILQQKQQWRTLRDECEREEKSQKRNHSTMVKSEEKIRRMIEFIQ